MADTEFYDVGPNRGRRDIDPTNRTQAYGRIREYQEDAIVMDHDDNHVEIWVEGQLRDRYPLGTKIAGNRMNEIKEEDRRRRGE